MSRSLRSPLSRHLAGVMFLALVSSGLAPIAWADPKGPTPGDHNVAVMVTKMLQDEHLLRHPLDKEISERTLKKFLQTLDTWKLYFYQSDIDEFSKYKDGLCDATQKGDIRFAYTVFSRFLTRVDERVKMIDQLLAASHDFTKDEEMVTDKDLVQYPKTPEEALDRWRKRIKYDLLILKAEKAESKADKKPDLNDGKTPQQRLTQRYHSFAKRMHQTDTDELLEMYLTAMTTSLDPHTDYMSRSSFENFRIMMGLKLQGIGASLQSVDGYTVVKQIIRGGAADKEGQLKVDDRIIGVGAGESGEMTDIVDMKLNDVVKMIRGKPGTVVRLQVLTPGNEKKIIKITRANIELKDSEAQGKVFEVGRKADGKPYKIGVIDLPSFYSDMEGAESNLSDYKSSTRDVRRILDDFNSKGVEAVVLDLRFNGGGSLPEAINLTGLFIPEGPVVQVKGASGSVNSLDDRDRGVAWSGPLVVVINKFSASASEILAGAIQDYGRGLIVGDHSSHGKGSVQSLQDVGKKYFGPYNPPRLGALKLTMQQFYRPGGDSTQKRGVLADVELPSLTTHLDVGEADLDYALPFDKVDAQPFKKFSEVSPALVDQIRKRSTDRCAAADKFQKVLRNIARYKEQKAKKSVTLNEAKFLKERAEVNADKEEEKSIEKLNDVNRKGIEKDYYLDEVFSITEDYMSQATLAKAQ